MTISAFLFGSIVAILLGALFHLWRGGGPFYILLYITASLIGFWTGHFSAQYLNLTLWNVGPVEYGIAILSAVIFLFLTNWLFNKKPLEK